MPVTFNTKMMRKSIFEKFKILKVKEHKKLSKISISATLLEQKT